MDGLSDRWRVCSTVILVIIILWGAHLSDFAGLVPRVTQTVDAANAKCMVGCWAVGFIFWRRRRVRPRGCHAHARGSGGAVRRRNGNGQTRVDVGVRWWGTGRHTHSSRTSSGFVENTNTRVLYCTTTGADIGCLSRRFRRQARRGQGSAGSNKCAGLSNER